MFTSFTAKGTLAFVDGRFMANTTDTNNKVTLTTSATSKSRHSCTLPSTRSWVSAVSLGV
jgi:hypothetical protein